MKLAVLERLMLLNILPREGDFTTLKIVRKMREDLSFTDAEHQLLNLHPGADRNVEWDEPTEGPYLADITISSKSTEIICDRLKELDQQKKLRMEHYHLYEMFVVGEE